MELPLKDLAAYLSLSAKEPEAALAKFAARIEKGEIRLADIRISRDLTAAVRLAPLGPRSAVLVGPHGEDRAAAGLLGETLGRATELGVKAISSRPRVGRVGPEYHAALLSHGFIEHSRRVEFKAPVADLPPEDGTPLLWRDLDEVGLDAAAAVLGESAEGDPHGQSERDHPAAELTEWLADPVLTDGPECVHVGYEDDRTVAFVCAQVWPGNGWSRIAYMGLVPAARGRGLGRWVHRHGFQMIRAQGGTRYHGGTATDNPAMIRLFLAHGCVESERMHDFEWGAEEGI